jgi:hypothetical protein
MTVNSRRALSIVFAVACAVWAGGPAAATPQDALPAARDIIARHLAAIGGEAAFRAIKSVHARGRLEIPSQNISGTLELFSARPSRLLYRVEVAGIGRIENGYDGKAGWSISPIAGPELLTGRQLTEAADDAWFDGPLHASDHVRELTTVARTDFDGQPAYRVKVVFTSGNEQTEYYDINTGLQIGSEATRTTPQGAIPTTNILRNYQKFGPLLQATTVVQRALGFEQVVTITSCEYDTVADSTFDPPAEVRALMRQ